MFGRQEVLQTRSLADEKDGRQAGWQTRRMADKKNGEQQGYRRVNDTYDACSCINFRHNV